MPTPLTLPTGLPLGDYYPNVQSADVNFDGKLDVIYAHWEGGFYWNAGNGCAYLLCFIVNSFRQGQFGARTDINNDFNAEVITMVDLNNDGLNDFSGSHANCFVGKVIFGKSFSTSPLQFKRVLSLDLTQLLLLLFPIQIFVKVEKQIRWRMRI